MPAETQDQDERRENAGRALKTQTFRGKNKRQIWSQKWAKPLQMQTEFYFAFSQW